MRRNRKLALSVILTVASLLLTVFCICGTVSVRNSGRGQMQDRYYRSLEQEYKQELCHLLETEGYQNSGIMLTYVTEEDGIRSYTVTIHHRRIDQLDEESRQELISRCREVPFPTSDCLFFHEFLVTDL